MNDADIVKVNDILSVLARTAERGMRKRCIDVVRGEAKELQAGHVRFALEKLAEVLENLPLAEDGPTAIRVR